jgi:hypothetical protein
MGGMSLDDNRATGGECGGRIPSGGREGQGKVGRAKHRDRPDRPLHQADFGARGRLTVGQRGIDTKVQIGAGLDMACEKPQLARGAPPFTLQAGNRQTGFLRADFGDRIGARLDLVGDGVQKGRTLGTGQLRIAVKRGLCRSTGLGHQRRCAHGKAVCRPESRLRGERAVAVAPFACDQMFAGRCICHVKVPFRERPRGTGLRFDCSIMYTKSIQDDKLQTSPALPALL